MRPRAPWLLVLVAVALRAAAADPPPAGAAGQPAPADPGPARRGPETVTLRFGWRPPLDAQVVHRRTRTRTGAPATSFVARYVTRVREDGEALRLETAGTRWDGDLPYPPALAAAAAAASEQVIRRVGPDGEFLGLSGEEALRPVLAALCAEARLEAEQAERAEAAGLAAAGAEAEEHWNRAVGFWIGAELELGQPYVMRSDARLPLVPGTRADTAVEFQVRRRVPCTAAEREARCVEVTLRSAPEPAEVERLTEVVAARLSTPDAPVAAAALAGAALESELLIVTEPDTLLPHRLVWTESLRAPGLEAGAPLEVVDRTEYDYRWAPAQPPAPAKAPSAKPTRRRAPKPAPQPAADGQGPSASR